LKNHISKGQNLAIIVDHLRHVFIAESIDNLLAELAIKSVYLYSIPCFSIDLFLHYSLAGVV